MKLAKLIQNHIQIIGLILLIIISILSTTFYSSYKKNQIAAFQKTLENIYLKKTIHLIIENLKPRYDIIDLKIQAGDTIEKILNKINIPKNEKDKILSKVSKFKFTRDHGPTIFYNHQMLMSLSYL